MWYLYLDESRDIEWFEFFRERIRYAGQYP